MMSNLLDHKGRIILKFDFDGNIQFGRHKDMLEKDKELLLGICEDMSSGIDKEDLRKFLDFEKEDFCS